MMPRPGGPFLAPRGGGMHVGPGDPMFDTRIGPGGGPAWGGGRPGMPGGLPGSMRWDPIAPEGLRGWNPDDYTR